MYILFRRTNFAFIISSFALLMLFGCNSITSNTPNILQITSTGSESKVTPPEYDEVGNTHGLSELDIARRRVALRSVIRKGDYYHARNDAIQAVEYYQKAFEQIKDDPKIAIRLANAYLEIKKFREAADIFVKFNLSNFDEPSKLKVIASIMLDSVRNDKQEVIKSLNLTEGTKVYLGIIDDCTNNPNECLRFIQESTSPDYQIQALRETIQSAKGISDDTLYIKTLLIGKLFEQKAYLAVQKIGLSILDIRPNYKVVLKIVGYSDFELGNYQNAGKYLEQYYTLEPKDVEVAYMLGIVNFYQGDYSTSNLYFNSAVLNGYTPKTELERRLVYNYVLLGDSTGAFKIFRFLLDEKDVLAEDYQIALFIAEQAHEYSKVSLWSRKGLEKFPNDPVLYTYSGMASLRTLDLFEAEQSLLQAISFDKKQPITLLELGRFYIQKQQYDMARDYLTNTIANDQGGYFASEAEKLLSTLPTVYTATGSIQDNLDSEGNIATIEATGNENNENLQP